MNKVVIVSIFCVLLTRSGSGQCASGPAPSPKTIVEQLWMTATQGELLTPGGWDKAAKSFFTDPKPAPGNNKMILIISNEWGLPGEEINGDKATVYMGYEDVGQIDSALRYTPPKSANWIKTGISYRLVLVPTFAIFYAPDGRTVVEKKPTGCHAWQIQNPSGPGVQGAPWTTVNTAIRYVLEMRAKTNDQVIRRNADATIARLLKVH
jgi:hypothetical protein